MDVEGIESLQDYEVWLSGNYFCKHLVSEGIGRGLAPSQGERTSSQHKDLKESIPWKTKRHDKDAMRTVLGDHQRKRWFQWQSRSGLSQSRRLLLAIFSGSTMCNTFVTVKKFFFQAPKEYGWRSSRDKSCPFLQKLAIFVIHWLWFPIGNPIFGNFWTAFFSAVRFFGFWGSAARSLPVPPVRRASCVYVCVCVHVRVSVCGVCVLLFIVCSSFLFLLAFSALALPVTLWTLDAPLQFRPRQGLINVTVTALGGFPRELRNRCSRSQLQLWRSNSPLQLQNRATCELIWERVCCQWDPWPTNPCSLALFKHLLTWIYLSSSSLLSFSKVCLHSHM